MTKNAAAAEKMPIQTEPAGEDTSKNVFYGPIKHFPEQFSTEDKTRLRDALNLAINEQLIPSYKKLSAFFSGEYLAAARSTSGINSLPEGDAMYQFFVSYGFTHR